MFSCLEDDTVIIDRTVIASQHNLQR